MLRKTAKLHANNTLCCSKAPKETPILGALPRTLPPLKRRAKLLIVTALVSVLEKDSLYQSFRQAFFKRPRIPSSSVLFLCVELAGADLFAVVVYGDIG